MIRVCKHTKLTQCLKNRNTFGVCSPLSAVSCDTKRLNFFLFVFQWKCLKWFPPIETSQKRFRPFCSMVKLPLAANLCMCALYTVHFISWWLLYVFCIHGYICVRKLFAQLLPSAASNCILYMCQTKLKIIRARKCETATYSNCTIYAQSESTASTEIANKKWTQNRQRERRGAKEVDYVRLLQKIRIKL